MILFDHLQQRGFHLDEALKRLEGLQAPTRPVVIAASQVDEAAVAQQNDEALAQFQAMMGGI